MSDRLKQIWSGFEETTSRQLTGRGVDNIIVPHRNDYAAVDEALLPENFSAPAEAAFDALRENLAKKEKKFSLGRKKGRTPTEAEDFVSATAFSAASEDLVQGLKATAMRTERADNDYGAFLTTGAGKALLKKHKKKKIFGLF